MTSSELELKFREAQLELLLIEIEERKFRLSEEKKRTPKKVFHNLPKTFIPKDLEPTLPVEQCKWKWKWDQLPQVTSEQKYFLGDAGQAVINCGDKYEV